MDKLWDYFSEIIILKRRCEISHVQDSAVHVRETRYRMDANEVQNTENASVDSFPRLITGRCWRVSVLLQILRYSAHCEEYLCRLITRLML